MATLDTQLHADAPEPGTPQFFAALDAAVAAGVRDALLRHKLRGESVVEWRDGKVVTVCPDDIVIPEESQASVSPESKPSAA